MRKALLGAVILSLCVTMAAQAQDIDDRVSTSEKGTLLFYPKVEIRWDDQGNLLQDTIITLANDWPANTKVLLYFVSETCTWVDNDIYITMNEPCFWAASTGLPKGVSPWTVLGEPYPDPEGSGDMIMRGYVVAWAVDAINREVCWNHLYGGATLINYANGYAWEYSAYAFQALPGGDVDCPPGALLPAPYGELNLNGIEFDYAFRNLLFTFFAPGTDALSIPGYDVGVETDLTLMIACQDLRQDNYGPYCTKANFEIWNENEVSFSGMHLCFCKWYQVLLSTLGGHFLVENLQTDLGRARVTGIQSIVCPASQDFPLLGVIAKFMTVGSDMAASGTHLVGAGIFDQGCQVLYDTTDFPPPQPQGQAPISRNATANR